MTLRHATVRTLLLFFCLAFLPSSSPAQTKLDWAAIQKESL